MPSIRKDFHEKEGELRMRGNKYKNMNIYTKWFFFFTYLFFQRETKIRINQELAGKKLKWFLTPILNTNN